MEQRNRERGGRKERRGGLSERSMARMLRLIMQQCLPLFIVFASVFVPLQLINHCTGNLVGTIVYFVPVILLIYVMMQHGQVELEKQRLKLQARARIDQLMRQVTTPKESAEWFNRFFEWFWMGYLRKIFQANLAAVVTEQLIAGKPKFMKALTLRKLYLGNASPQVVDMSTLSGGDYGVNILEAGLSFQSHNLCIDMLAEAFLLKGRPILISITHIGLEGPLRIVPFVDKEAFMFTFKTKPVVSLEFKVTTAAGMQLMVSDIPGLADFLKNFCENMAKNLVTSPNYMCNSLVGQLMSNKLNKIFVSRGVVRVAFDAIQGLEPGRTYLIKTQLGGKEMCRDTNKFTLTGGSADAISFAVSESVDLNFIKSGGRLYIRVLQLKNAAAGTSTSNLVTVASCRVSFAIDCDGSLYAYGFSRGPFFERVPKEVRSLSLNISADEDNGVGIGMSICVLQEQHADNMVAQGGGLTRMGSTHTLELQVIEAKNLVPRDSSGKSDPYCKIEYGPRCEMTEVQRKTLMPQWGEYFEFEERWESKYRFIQLRIYDYDDVTSDDQMGDVIIPLDGVYVDTHLDLWVPLNNVESGEIHIRLGLRQGPPRRLFSKAVRARSDQSIKEGDEVLEVCIKEGRSLASRDRGNKSDGFVELLYGSHKTKTQVIKKTLNPRWEHAVLLPYIRDEMIFLSCYDKDFHGKDPIGYTEVGCEPAVLHEGEEVDAWHKLKDVESGELRVVMRYHRSVKLPKNTLELATQKPKMSLKLQQKRTMRLNTTIDASTVVEELCVDDVIFDEDKPRAATDATSPPASGSTRDGGPDTTDDAGFSLDPLRLFGGGAGTPTRREAQLAKQVEELEAQLAAQDKKHEHEKTKLQKEQQLVLSKVKVLESAMQKLPLEKLKKLSKSAATSPARTATPASITKLQ